MLPTRAYLIAGGKGTRFGEISKYLPKCLMPVCKRSILGRNLQWLADNGIYNVTILAGHNADFLQEFLEGKKWQTALGAPIEVNVDVVVESEPLGTAGCLKGIEGPYIAFNADSLYDFDLVDFVKKAHAFGGVTIATKRVEDATGFGLVTVERLPNTNFGLVRGFKEKPTEPVEGDVSVGFYYVNQDLNIGDGFQMLEKDVFPVLAKDNKLFAYTAADWSPIDDEVKLAKAEEWLQHKVNKAEEANTQDDELRSNSGTRDIV